MSLKDLRVRAKAIGIKIEADRDDVGWGYWVIDAATGEGPWEDDNFSTCHDELAGDITRLELERA